MLKIPLVTWIANATAVLTGGYGEVTLQAEVADCSRQTIYDHAHKVQAAVVEAHDGGPTRATLIAENQRLGRENAQLWRWLQETIEFPVIKQHEFATAAAMGLSLNQSRHRTVSQGLLDLKRLYWNCREVREGKRGRRCPYELLGLKLPGDRFWDLLCMPTTPKGRA